MKQNENKNIKSWSTIKHDAEMSLTKYFKTDIAASPLEKESYNLAKLLETGLLILSEDTFSSKLQLGLLYTEIEKLINVRAWSVVNVFWFDNSGVDGDKERLVFFQKLYLFSLRIGEEAFKKMSYEQFLELYFVSRKHFNEDVDAFLNNKLKEIKLIQKKFNLPKYTTCVTPTILSHVPILNELDKVKYLKCDVCLDMLNIMVTDLCGILAIEEEYTKLFKFNVRHYQSGARYKCNLTGIEFSLLSGALFVSPYMFQVQVNPRHFSNANDLKTFIERLMGRPLDVLNHKVTRVDIAFTLPTEVFTPALIHFCGNLKWKQYKTNYIANSMGKGALTGTRTNSRSMNVVIYERDATVAGGEETSSIRFEYQIKGCSIETLGLGYFDGLFNIDVNKIFKRIGFYNTAFVKPCTDNQKSKFEKFQMDLGLLGFQQAKLNYNKNNSNNFNRDIKRFLVPLTMNNGKALVENCLKKRFKEWFKKWKK